MSRASNVEGRNNTFTCSTCGKTFDNQSTLDSHMSMDHSVQAESPAGVG
jgi:ribosomal protein L31